MKEFLIIYELIGLMLGMRWMFKGMFDDNDPLQDFYVGSFIVSLVFWPLSLLIEIIENK